MTGFENLCMSCMSDTGGKSECPHCGCAVGEAQTPHALPPGTELQERYIVGRAKSVNGEGVTYIAYDTAQRAPVELREFFPQTLCGRAENGKDISVIGGNEIVYSETLSAFLNYSREIAHLRELSALIQIYDIFEENHTAYTVSEWSESITLHYFVERSGGNLTWNAARQLFMPVLSALSSMHRAGLSHLGISTETLCIMPDGRMKLGSFCISDVRRMDTDLPPELVPGCAAIEQYVMDYVPDESTDVYGFAASLFFALTGSMPMDALKRRTDSRLLIPTSLLRAIPPHVVSALANALQVSPDKRTSTFERLRAELSAAPTVTVALDDPLLRGPGTAEKNAQPEGKKDIPGFVWVMLSCLVTIVVLTIVGVIWLSNTKPLGTEENSSSESPSSAVGQDVSQAMSAMAKSVSSETEKIITPNLAGKNYEAIAAESEKNASYQVLISTKQFSDTEPEGCIISQTPASGTEMDKGTAIVVIVSQGAAIRTLPEITGKSLVEASDAVTSAGLVPVKEVTYSDAIPEDSVVGYKGTQAGAQLPYGSQVTILVSQGPQSPAPSQPEPVSSSLPSGMPEDTEPEAAR